MQTHSPWGTCKLPASPLVPFFERRLRLRIDCEYQSFQFSCLLDLFDLSLSRILFAKTNDTDENSTVRRHVEILELKNVASRHISELRQSQRVLMPGLIPTLDETDDGRATEGSITLFLPSELCSGDRSAWCLPEIPSLEFRFRYAQADDTLAQLRRLLRLRQNLRNQNAKHLSHAQKALTRTKGIFDSLRIRIARSKDRYLHARRAMLALDPDQKFSPGWMDRFQSLSDGDVCGPGRNPDDASEGQFRPSWIWLVPRLSRPPPPATATPSGDRVVTANSNSVSDSTKAVDQEQTDSMRAHWAKCHARAERYEEEVLLTLEEMGRTLRYFEWKRDWWLALQSEREMSESPPPASVRRGLQAYAHRQANVYDSLALSFLKRWRKTIVSRDLKPAWLSNYPATAVPHAVPQDCPQPATLSVSTDSAHKPPPSLPPLPHTDHAGMPLTTEGETGDDESDSDYDGGDHDDDDDHNDDAEYVFDEAGALEYDFEDELTA
jgi:hypothetical protein